MKKIILPLVLFFVTTLAFAQSSNKFSKGDFGIRYGIFFGNTTGSFSSDLNFSGMLTDHLEFGSGINIGLSSASNKNTDSTFVFTTAGNVLGTQSNITRNGTLTVGVNPFLAYHFPIKGRIDVYLGVNVGFNVTATLKDETSTELQAANYLDKSVISVKSPVGYGVGGGLSIGCRYFFNKHIALGVQAGLGANAVFTKGEPVTTSTTSSSGSANSQNGTSTSVTTYGTAVDNKAINFGTLGNVGVTLSFYLSPKKAEAAPATSE